MGSTTEGARVRAVISGRVQGVGFRYHIRDCARKFGVVGWVRNLRSGDVEFVAEGERESLERLLKFAREGPPMSWVQGLRVDWSAPHGDLSAFELTSTM